MYIKKTRKFVLMWRSFLQVKEKKSQDEQTASKKKYNLNERDWLHNTEKDDR